MNTLEILGFAFIIFIILAIIFTIWWKIDCYFEQKREQQDKRIENMVWFQMNQNKRKEKEEIDLRFSKLEKEIHTVKDLAISKIVFVDTPIIEKKKK